MRWRLFRLTARLAVAGFFRRVEVEGGEHLPASRPLLLLPNHNNAFVDALVVVGSVSRAVTLTAKSTLFGSLALRPLLAFAGAVPLFRRQDRAAGADPARNAESLEACRRVLASGGAVCIFPEGVSHSDAHLRPLRTGAARLVLDFLAQGGEGLAVVPVGLHWEQKEGFRSAVRVRFGEPLDASAWRGANPEAGTRELSAEIERGIRSVTVNVDRRRDALLIEWAAELLATKALPPPTIGREAGALGQRAALAALLADGIARLPPSRDRELEALAGRVREYRRRLKALGVAPQEVYLEMETGPAALFVVRELELLVVGLPLAAAGALLHAPAYLLVSAVARRLSTDRDHWATNAVIPGMAAVPLLWAVEIAAAWCWLSWPWAAAFTALLPYSGAYALLYADRAGGVLRRARTFVRFLLRPAEHRELAREGREIVEGIEELGKELSA